MPNSKYDNDVKTSHKIVATVNVRTYDVWGNAKDGYEVNDSYNQGDQEVVLNMTLMGVLNVPEGESLSFRSDSIVCSYEIPDKTIRDLLGVGPRVAIEIDGDDRTYYVNRERDSYPLGEIYIESWREFNPEKDSQ